MKRPSAVRQAQFLWCEFPSEYETLILTRRDVELLTTVQIKMWPHLWPSILGKYNSFLSNSITEYWLLSITSSLSKKHLTFVHAHRLVEQMHGRWLGVHENSRISSLESMIKNLKIFIRLLNSNIFQVNASGVKLDEIVSTTLIHVQHVFIFQLIFNSHVSQSS